LYFTPSGRSIQAKGIQPDILVERARITAIKPRSRITEADLSGHLDNASGSEESSSSDRIAKQEERSDELFNRDNQLFEALTLLRGLHIFGQHSQVSAQTLAKAENESSTDGDASELDDNP